ncbi:MAG TPA: hypothetical protein VMH27_18600, partial [Puia sp.]|nr:hypothetical protein [Puia sp.]
MRKKISMLLPALVGMTGGLFILPGCLKDRVIETYKIYEPIYAPKASVLAAINADPGTPVSQPGQLYIKGSYIFLNDVDRGIHVIDNSDPRHPVQTAFLNIPGNLNIGIRNNILYADMYADVLAIDISNLHQVKIIGMLRNFFSSREYFADTNYVVANWVIRDTSVVPQGYAIIPHTRNVINPGGLPVYYDLANASAAAGGASGTGTAGSNAVMTLV